MLPVSDSFLAALRGSHGIAVSAILCDPPGQTGVTPTGRELAVESGAVTLDAGADVRGTLELVVTDEPWPDEFSATDLTPYGAEIFVTRGVVLGNGAVQRAPLGYYRLTLVEQGEAPTGALHITGQDRMSAIVEARLEAPVQYLAIATYGDVVEDLVTGVYPGATIEWDDDTLTGQLKPIGRTVIAEEDRAGFLRELVTSLGKVMYFDYDGVLRVLTPPDPTVPVFDVDAGAGGVLISVSRTLTRDGVYNAVVATGEALDDQVPSRGVARDTDPTSPTYYGGPFGVVPRFFTSPLLTTDAQAVAAATSLLEQSRGLPYSVDFTAVPNPALVPLDVVRVTYPPVLGQSPTTRREIHVLDQIGIPLDSGGVLTAKTRLQTGGV